MSRDELVLPRKINAANEATFARTAEEFSGDTFNFLRKLKDRSLRIQAAIDALETELGGIVSFPGFGGPSQGIGGGNTAGVSPLVAHADHDHTLRETSGPTDLTMGSILDNESVRRVGGQLAGRIFRVLRRAGSASTSVTTPADVSGDLSVDLKAATANMVVWVIYYLTAATTTGLRVGLNFSGTLNTIHYGLLGATGATAMQSEFASTNDTLVGQAAVGPGGTARVAILFGMVRTTSDGTLVPRYASGVAGSAVTIAAQTHMFVLQL